MTERELVVLHVTDRMHRAFAQEDMALAQDLENMLTSLEGCSDTQYVAMYDEPGKEMGAIS